MKETEERYEESVGVVLAYGPSLSSVVSKTKTNNNERFLLVKSPRGDWNFVKGHKEKEQTDYETLRREIFEETSITRYNILSYLGKIKYKFKKNGSEIKKEVRYYYAFTDTKRILLSNEHVDYTWLKYSQARRLLTFYQSKLILGKIFECEFSY
jgi:8-oxo-dGTP pyrophosphatase MutT (NUDIX family)